MLVVPTGQVSGLAALTWPATANAPAATSDSARAGPATRRRSRWNASNPSRSIAVPFLRCGLGRPLRTNWGGVERHIVKGDVICAPCNHLTDLDLADRRRSPVLTGPRQVRDPDAVQHTSVTIPRPITTTLNPHEIPGTSLP